MSLGHGQCQQTQTNLQASKTREVLLITTTRRSINYCKPLKLRVINFSHNSHSYVVRDIYWEFKLNHMDNKLFCIFYETSSDYYHFFAKISLKMFKTYCR